MAPLSDEEFRLLREWIAEEYGVCFGDSRRDVLRSRLDPFRSGMGFASFRELFFHLRFHPARAEAHERLLPFLTNNESYFFRERAQLELLAGEILPALRERLRAGSEREVRVLSAACAAGEEAYTLAMVARESGVFAPPWSVAVTGGDLDPEALRRARAGRYTAHAFRGVEPGVRARFFREAGEGEWQIDDTLHSAVRFRPLNLIGDGWSRTLPPQHVIFCRNVLIYFDDSGIQKAADELYRALAPGGYLFLGHAESLSRIATPLLPERRPGAIFYRRAEE
jgi:chemotaxis protein methyltransferase CheR